MGQTKIIQDNKDLTEWLEQKPVRVIGLNPIGKSVRGKMVPTVKFDASGSLIRTLKYRKAA